MEPGAIEPPQNPRENETSSKKRTLARTVDAATLSQWLEDSLQNCPADTNTRQSIREAVLSLFEPTPIESAERTKSPPTRPKPSARHSTRKTHPQR